jgi:hypothetical protein
LQIADLRLQIEENCLICNLKSAICNGVYDGPVPSIPTPGRPAVTDNAFAIATAELLANPAGLFIRGAAYQFHLGVLRTGVSRTEIPDVDDEQIFVHRLSHCVLPGL